MIAEDGSPFFSSRSNRLFRGAIVICALTLGGCFSSSPDEGFIENIEKKPSVPADVLISWAANREAAVNTTGGGYKVSYSTDSTFPAGSTTTLDVPYSSGASAPTSIMVSQLNPGTYYVRITAYTASLQSLPSSRITVTVP